MRTKIFYFLIKKLFFLKKISSARLDLYILYSAIYNYIYYIKLYIFYFYMELKNFSVDKPLTGSNGHKAITERKKLTRNSLILYSIKPINLIENLIKLKRPINLII